MGNRIAAVLTILVCLCFWVSEVKANENDVKKSTENELWHIGPRIGATSFYSYAFIGLIGLEFQYRHFALAVEAPGNVDVIYYFAAPKSSWFINGFISKYDSDSDETKDGITYTEFNELEGGVAGGYRWRWGSGWDLSLSLGMAYGERELTNSLFKSTEKYIGVRPKITFGYSF